MSIEERPAEVDDRQEPGHWEGDSIVSNKEGADCAGMQRSCTGSGTRTTIYYCHPYSSYEKGSVERQNGMTRRRHPKGTDFSNVSPEEIKATEEWINNYPRKMFDYHTSAELFAAAFPEAARLFSTPA